ncbi:uncharacterized protein LOC133478409 isoform X2 [Phyllopteryx taeniolatus]|nr:uncharacterized protein LOC133478409 isoform X2 [Phyllopteryx taeniolatus]XP_061630432.1 uncharacterized protein LOC133478409 isoform X2 [Phyllopteryx taeniolatus]
MRLALRTLLCCCVLTAVMPLMRSAVVRKRFKGRLQMKRDAAGEVHTGLPQQGGDARTELSASSLFFNIRRRRSPSKTSGCFLFSCAYHDLLHRLSQMHDNDKKVPTAPKDKMLSIGRRRRSTEDPMDAPTPQTMTEGIPCWVCLLTTDKDKSSLVKSLGRTQSVEGWPHPTQQAP